MIDEKPIEFIPCQGMTGASLHGRGVLPTKAGIFYLDIETIESSIASPDPLKFEIPAEIKI